MGNPPLDSPGHIIKHLCFVLPAYNEQGNLKVLMRRIAKSMQGLQIPYSIVFVIQGLDGTLEEVKHYSATLDAVETIIEHSPYPLGVGPAFARGFSLIPPQITHVVTMDCDLNHSPEEIRGLLEPIQTGKAEFVIGSRYIAGGKIINFPVWKRGLSYLTNRLLMSLTGVPIVDKSSGYRVFAKKVLNRVLPHLEQEGFGFYVEFLLTAYRQKVSITEAPITFIRRVRGKSKMAILPTLKSYVRLIAKARRIVRG